MLGSSSLCLSYETAIHTETEVLSLYGYEMTLITCRCEDDNSPKWGEPVIWYSPGVIP
jgi:hypothetical protein